MKRLVTALLVAVLLAIGCKSQSSYVNIRPDSWDIEKTCQSLHDNSNYTVIEHRNRYWLIKTTGDLYLTTDHVIKYLGSLNFGGVVRLEYIDLVGTKKRTNVTVIDRAMHHYAGYTGAVSVCRDLADGKN